MKSGIEMMNNCDPFMGIGEGLLAGVEDPDCLCGSRGKGTCYDEHYRKFLLTSFDPLIGDVNCLDSSIEEFMDYTDNQLESIILNGAISASTDELFNLMNDLSADEEQQARVLATQLDLEDIGYDLASPSPSMSINAPSEHDYCNTSDFAIPASDMASSASNTTLSSPSYSADYNMPPSPASTAPSMATIKNAPSPPSRSVKKPTKRTNKKKAKRPKRINDDRLKLQNKVAAIKYRQRKKQEQEDIGEKVRLEEEKNMLLKTKVQELEVQIKVIKELVGKYLQDALKQK